MFLFSFVSFVCLCLTYLDVFVAAIVDVAATAAGFHGVVRIADATGIPVVNEMSLGVRTELKVDHFYASGLGDRGGQ